ncbi:hypothetical protein Vadar_005858 [Vaccinium darrowii]|uniref:Uncharacterized protein n=1 Tax=Vaccinium darrowii TaxID=229202 RepID=A0ACB7XX25_9ERIC|nr:hypothetical protein Vadar_005858 [Vaccinium darrowii]
MGSPSPSKWPILAVFAGWLHRHIWYLLLKQWKEIDRDVQVYNSLPNGVTYESILNKGQFRLCPSGSEVASPRFVEAIYSECFPVLISNGYIPPSNYVLQFGLTSLVQFNRFLPNNLTVVDEKSLSFLRNSD